jgi:hypothetical protein
MAWATAMKIDSGLSGYYYQNRNVDTERKQEETQQTSAPPAMRLPGALTGSSTLLSTSLANALWVMEAGDASAASSQPAPMEQDWVRDVFQEFT